MRKCELEAGWVEGRVKEAVDCDPGCVNLSVKLKSDIDCC